MSKPKTRPDGLIEKTKTINGKRLHFYGKSSREVQKKIDDAIACAAEKSERGDLFEDVAKAFWAWKEPKLKYGSVKSYRPKVDKAIDWFGGCGMKEITSTDINNRLSKMALDGCSYKSVSGQKSVISLIYQYWCANMGGDRNPCALLKLPQGLPQQKRSAPTDKEIALVKSHAEGFGLCAAFAMYAGLRLGEIMALQKQDLSGGVISITKAVVWQGNRPVIDPPKTKNAIRKIPILSPLKEAIGNRLDSMRPDEYIFGGKQPITESQYNNAWLQYAKSIGCAKPSGIQHLSGKKSAKGIPLYKSIWVPNFTIHQLRHEFASTLVQCGIRAEVAKELMGHADILTTQRWYVEVKQGAINEAAEILNDHFKSC